MKLAGFTEQERKDRRRAQRRESYARHREKTIMRTSAYLKNHREQQRAWSRARYARKREQECARATAYRMTHPRTAEQLARMRAASKAWRVANKGYDSLRYKTDPEYAARKLKQSRAYVARNHDAIRERSNARYASDPNTRLSQRIRAHRRRNAEVAGSLTPQQWQGVFSFYEGRCVYCGESGTSIDHVLPIVRGGTHSIDNVVPACRRCNSSKRSRTPTEWYAATRR
jgi:5-methylcytosine-specific restriction endonuclease McrA